MCIPKGQIRCKNTIAVSTEIYRDFCIALKSLEHFRHSVNMDGISWHFCIYIGIARKNAILFSECLIYSPCSLDWLGCAPSGVPSLSATYIRTSVHISTQITAKYLYHRLPKLLNYKPLVQCTTYVGLVNIMWQFCPPFNKKAKTLYLTRIRDLFVFVHISNMNVPLIFWWCVCMHIFTYRIYCIY